MSLYLCNLTLDIRENIPNFPTLGHLSFTDVQLLGGAYAALKLLRKTPVLLTFSVNMRTPATEGLEEIMEGQSVQESVDLPLLYTISISSDAFYADSLLRILPSPASHLIVDMRDCDSWSQRETHVQAVSAVFACLADYRKQKSGIDGPPPDLVSNVRPYRMRFSSRSAAAERCAVGFFRAAIRLEHRYTFWPMVSDLVLKRSCRWLGKEDIIHLSKMRCHTGDLAGQLRRAGRLPVRG